MTTKNLKLVIPTEDDQVLDTLRSLGQNFQAIDENVAIALRSGINLLNEDTLIPGKVPSITSGELENFTNYSASEFIPITAGKYYTQNEGAFRAWYNASKVFIKGENIQTSLAPVGAAFVRVAVNNSHVPGKAMFVEGTLLPPYESYHTQRLHPNIKFQHPLTGLKWGNIGDSISTNGYQGITTFPSYIFDRTGILVENYALPGSWLSNAPGAQDPMCVRYSGMSGDLDIITFFGGTNDAGGGAPIGTWGDSSTGTVYGGTRTLVEGLLTKYPSKRIGGILPTPRQGMTGPSGALKNVVNAIKDVCDRYSIPTLDLYTGSGLAPDFTASRNATMPDGLHPNSTGQKLLSYKIQDFLQRI